MEDLVDGEDDQTYEVERREREINAVAQLHQKAGFREGREAAQEEAESSGFQSGWEEGKPIGERFGRVIGLLRSLRSTTIKHNCVRIERELRTNLTAARFARPLAAI